MTLPIGRAPWRRPDAPRRSAYTLIELLLVLTLMLVAVGMAVPMFIHSLEGTRLRAAAKSVATAHRYARGMAVLNQAEVAILFDTETATLRVLRMDRPPPAPADASDPFSAGMSTSNDWLPSIRKMDSEETNVVERYTTDFLLERRLDPEVSIERIAGVDSSQQYKNQSWVVYQPNGMTRSYAVHLAEKRGGQTSVNIEGITGQVEFGP